MSQSDDYPSNARLAQRTARIEEQVGHVSDTVDRIENRLDEQHAELVDDVEENSQKVGQMWGVYRVSRWLVPIGIAVGSALGSLASGGLL